MTKRDPHPDNDLIARMQEEGGSGHQGRTGGLAGDIGTQDELENATGDAGLTRVTGSAKGGQDEMKGSKTRDHLRSSQRKDG